MNAVFVFIFFFLLLLFVSFLPLSLLVSYLATIVYSPLFHFASVQLKNDFVPCLTCIIAYVAHSFCSLLFFPDISSCARGKYV